MLGNCWEGRQEGIRTTSHAVAADGHILALFVFGKVLLVGEGAGELLGGNGGSVRGLLSIELLRTDISLLSLMVGGLCGGRCWRTIVRECRECIRTTFDAVAADGHILALFDFWRVL